MRNFNFLKKEKKIPVVWEDETNYVNLFNHLSAIDASTEWSQIPLPLENIRQVVFSDNYDLALLYSECVDPKLVSVDLWLKPLLPEILFRSQIPYLVLTTPLHKTSYWSKFLQSLYSLCTPSHFFLLFSIILPFLISKFELFLGDNHRSYITAEHPGAFHDQEIHWIGSPEVFRECIETGSFLNRNSSGPRGLLLEGPPGTGKTLLARKISQTINATFFPIVGSEFVEIFVGVGPRRVRDLFQTARRHAPSIIFIDEIDSVATARMGYGGASTEGDNTLNQILAEMDGFGRNDRVLIIGATNRVQLLDPAILRPGRFDRVVYIPLPDIISRRAMIEYFFEKEAISLWGLDVDFISSITQGWTGADIQYLATEARIIADQEECFNISMRHIEAALEKRLIGIVKSQEDRSPEEIHRVAIHELGHAVLVHEFPEYFRLRKISIKPTYSGIGGYTFFDETPRRDHSSTRDYFRKKIIVILGGKAAEEIFYGKNLTSNGSFQDLRTANDVAEAMVYEMGFSESLPYFISSDRRNLPPSTAEKAHQDVKAILNECAAVAENILTKHRAMIEKMTLDLSSTKTMNETLFLSYFGG